MDGQAQIKMTEEDFLKVVRQCALENPEVSRNALSKIVAERTPYTWRYVVKRLSNIEERSGSKTADVDEDTVKKNVSEISKLLRRSVSRYVVTWAQNATPVHPAFFAALLKYCSHNEAKLVVIPGRYKNPTSIVTQQQQQDEYWCDEVSPYLMNSRQELCPNLMVMGDIKIQPTAATPLTGFQSITHDRSGIFGHPKVQLTSIATPQNKLPKILTTTGAVTVKNYTDTKAGKKGDFHHTLGAAIVEIEKSSGLFHLRQINAVDDGSFIDMDREYTPKSVRRAKRPLALVMGDIHAEFMDSGVEAATFKNRDSIVNALNPEAVVLHDWIDFYSGSHHHRNDPFIQFAKAAAGRNNVEAELLRAVEKLKSWKPEKREFHIVASNHNDHLLRWLKENDPNKDPVNALFFHRLKALVLENVEYSKRGAEVPNPLQLWVENHTDLEGVHFLGRDESLMFDKVDCSQHGDIGANGSRGNVRQFSFQGVKNTTGHGHSPGIEGGAHRVGTSSLLKMGYNAGASSWMHAHDIIYANGKRSLLFIIDGKWKPQHKAARKKSA